MLQRPVNSIFQQPWWLDAVAPGSWDAVEIRGNDGLIDAWMPYVVRTDVRGLRVIDMPQLTMTLGPWVRQPTSDSNRRSTLHYMNLLGELADALPPANLFRQRFHPSLPTLLPFAQRGYDLHLAYTYVLDDLKDEESLWQGVSSSRRKDIRKARSRVRVESTDDLDVFLRLNRMTFERQGVEPPYSDEYVRRLDDACAAHSARRILLAVDEDGAVHGAEYIVYDSNTTYDLMSGLDPNYRDSNAGSLLVWEAIRFASGVSQKLDFEGGTMPAIEPFISSFGGKQTPYVVATKEDLRWRSLSLARDTARALKSAASSLSGRVPAR